MKALAFQLSDVVRRGDLHLPRLTRDDQERLLKFPVATPLSIGKVSTTFLIVEGCRYFLS
jgi:hypothetical protein